MTKDELLHQVIAYFEVRGLAALPMAFATDDAECTMCQSAGTTPLLE